MYLQIKQVVKKLLPQKLMYAWEPTLRSISSGLLYAGTQFKCNICNFGLSKYIEVQSGDLLCPHCGSIGRDRRLYELLSTSYSDGTKRILDFSPSRALYRELKRKYSQYQSTDLSGDFIADHSFDITQLQIDNDSFDLVICFHVLEHIEDDLCAMDELFRILKPSGSCLIQTPFKEGDTYEDLSITSPEQRLVHFGQEDHVRIYGLENLINRLESRGFHVTPLSFFANEPNIQGYNQTDHILVCRKTKLPDNF